MKSKGQSGRNLGVPLCETADAIVLAEIYHVDPRDVAKKLGGAGARRTSYDEAYRSSNGSSDLRIYPVIIDHYPDGLTENEVTKLLKECGF